VSGVIELVTTVLPVLVHLVTQVVRAWRQARVQADHDSIDRDPVGWGNEHFGVPVSDPVREDGGPALASETEV